ncbi:MAG: hypothetical protein HYT88_03895 [Candidatus Omnitrophica bacterium]|nr:hypothetical protein [Candidatus Omnitrophota bacterium]
MGSPPQQVPQALQQSLDDCPLAELQLEAPVSQEPLPVEQTDDIVLFLQVVLTETQLGPNDIAAHRTHPLSGYTRCVLNQLVGI